MDVPNLIRSARYAARLSQDELAARAGISQPMLSRYEHGVRQPSIGTLRRVLAAAGKQIRAELEPLDDDIRKAIAEFRSRPIDDHPTVLMWSGLAGLAEVNHRVEGLAAVSLLGAPVPVKELTVAMADEPATYRWLTTQLNSWSYQIRLPNWSWFHALQPQDADALRTILRDECPDGTFELSYAGMEGRVTLRAPEVVTEHVTITTPEGVFPVQPIHHIEIDDPEVNRVLDVLRAEASPGDTARGS